MLFSFKCFIVHVFKEAFLVLTIAFDWTRSFNAGSTADFSGILNKFSDEILQKKQTKLN
jgi:hypothetical protein